jgi:hypothetical protein
MPKDMKYHGPEDNGQPCRQNRVSRAEDLEEVLGEIVVRPVSRNIAVEFECGGCCKKATNGESIAVTEFFVIVRPAVGEHLEVRLFCDGKVADIQRAQIVVIPIDHVASIEFGAIEVC